MKLYSVKHWDDASLGGHRARVLLEGPVDEEGAIAWARIEWRLPGLAMEQRQLLLFEESEVADISPDFARVRNVLVLHSSSEAVEFLFEPTAGGGTYLCYYLAYKQAQCATGPASSCSAPYMPKRGTAARQWRARARVLTEVAGWRETLPRARLVGLHARTKRDAFHPMEVAPTASELATLAALGRPVLVWSEERKHPIRMTDAPPLRWLMRGVQPRGAATFSGSARRGEFFTFQVGAYAPLAPLVLRMSWGGLRGRATGKRLASHRLRCVNAPPGSVAAADGLHISRGEVLAIWFGLTVPERAVDDVYDGVITLDVAGGAVGGAGIAGGARERVLLSIRVGPERIEDHGDDDLWRHARLRWLDSDVGAEAFSEVSPRVGPPSGPNVDAIGADDDDDSNIDDGAVAYGVDIFATRASTAAALVGGLAYALVLAIGGALLGAIIGAIAGSFIGISVNAASDVAARANPRDAGVIGGTMGAVFVSLTLAVMGGLCGAFLGVSAPASTEAEVARVAAAGRSVVPPPPPPPIPTDGITWEPETQTMSLGVRQLRLSRRGLPASMRVDGIELLAAPARIIARTTSGDELRLAPLERRLPTPVTSGGAVMWTSHLRAAPAGGVVGGDAAGGGGNAAGGSTLGGGAAGGAASSSSVCPGLDAVVSGRMMPGGVVHMSIELTAPRGTCALADLSLRIPLRASEVPLINGFGYKGNTRPKSVQWRWDKASDSPAGHTQRGLNSRVWLGSTSAGLQLNLQETQQAAVGSSHCGHDEDGQLQCSDLSGAQYNMALGSAGWCNANRGSAAVEEEMGTWRSAHRLGARLNPLEGRGLVAEAREVSVREENVAMLSVSTGKLSVSRAPVSHRLEWRLLMTPVVGAGALLRADFETRHVHLQRAVPVEEATATVARPWIVLHQGNPLNQHTNYPFLNMDPLRQYIRKAHSAGAKVKLYYTVRELSSAATELWALQALRGEVLINSPAVDGHPWLREHVRHNYTAAWHEVSSNGEVDAAILTPAFTSRWDNYWIEGILWLARNLDIDGIYLDGAPYDYTILRRLRRALNKTLGSREFRLDLHASCAGNPHLPYTELYPYLDSLWLGEQCDYATYSPEQWLAEVSGVPFGLPSQVLGSNQQQWQGLIFGMTCRIYPDLLTCDPRPIYAALDGLRLHRPHMLGWWDGACPVRVIAGGSEGFRPGDVRATLFDGGNGALAIAIANFGAKPQQVRLQLDWSELQARGLTSGAATAKLVAEEIKGFQPAGRWDAVEKLSLQPRGAGFNEGWLLALR